MKKGVTILTVLVAVQGLAILLFLATDRGRGSVEAERLARPAPELVLRAADGSVSRLSDRRGSVIVLHFWATWCPPCREELPSLLRFAESGTVQVLAVSVDPEWPSVLSFVGQDAGPHLYLASAAAVEEDFHVSELPQSFVIDPGGILRLRFHGPRDWDSRAVRRMVAAVRRP